MTNEKEEKVIKAYDKYAKRVLEDGYRFNPVYIASKALSDWVLLTSIDLKGKRVLNIGCAEPIDELQFVERVDEWVSLDVNPKMIKTAREVAERKLNSQLFSKLEFVTADATRMPFDDETFDIVTAFSSIEHIPDAKLRHKAIEEMVRVVKRSGYVIITVPNRWNLKWYLWSIKAMREGTTDFGYCYNYSPLEIRRDLIDARLRIIKYSSDFKMTYGFVPFLPLGYIIERFRIYFGERMGYLAQKV